MNRILVPISFSTGSANALKYANQLVSIYGKELTLFYCYPLQEYNRKYDFGKKDYAKGIREMLAEFYENNIGVAPLENIKFLAKPGFVGEKIVHLSQEYDMVILNTNYFKSGFQRWMESRASSIASTAKCPVLIVSPRTSFNKWENIWHIKRRDKEGKIINQFLNKSRIREVVIKEKLFEQQAFNSPLWRAMVAFRKHPDKALHDKVLDKLLEETIDLLVLVSHQRDTFQYFLSSDLMQLIFRFQIPVLVLQAPHLESNSAIVRNKLDVIL